MLSLQGMLTAQEIISIYNGESVDLDNVVGQYDFNEGSGSVLTDLSGNGNNGTIYGATLDKVIVGVLLKMIFLILMTLMILTDIKRKTLKIFQGLVYLLKLTT